MNFIKKRKPVALVFVDFEYMQISFKKRYGMEPPVLAWYRELCEIYDIAELYVFADFSNPAMKHNLPQLRRITGHIIETQNTSSRHKKDFTDFFLLDQIYQKAFEKHSAKTYILFTGDGHFGAVSRFLITKCKKEVVIYGIAGNISSGLRVQASRVVEYPAYETLKKLYYPLLAQQMRAMQTGDAKKSVYLTADAVVRATASEKNIEIKTVKDALDDMIACGYAGYEEQWISSIKRTRVLVCYPERLQADGFYYME